MADTYGDIATPKDDLDEDDYSCVNCGQEIGYSDRESLWYHEGTYSIRCHIELEDLKMGEA